MPFECWRLVQEREVCLWSWNQGSETSVRWGEVSLKKRVFEVVRKKETQDQK